MALKLMFEIGHLASRKTKPSKEGFTHDWELYVRGVDGASIEHFVEKIVFNLHDSFPKPKRVIKEPPYSVKESGYAGFLLTIDIYLKNRDEPKKCTYEYDLDLQPFKMQLCEKIVPSPSDDFKKKCLKGGATIVSSSSEPKNREPYKSLPLPTLAEHKKSMKRPEETKPNKTFTDLFGAPLKKPEARVLQNASPNPTKAQPPASKGVEKAPSSSVSGSKDKTEKSKHKHSPNKDGKDSKKTSETKSESKKDKTKDRERSEKKDKTSKRPASPSPISLPPPSSSSARNSTNLTSQSQQSKNDSAKVPSKQPAAPGPPTDSSFNKKSSKKDKKSHDKERERNEKKDSRAKEGFAGKDKSHFELPPSKGSTGGVKERDSNAGKDDRDKGKTKSIAPEPKAVPAEVSKKQHDKEPERKHKHKKKEKSKDKEVGNKKEKQHKNATAAPAQVKAKEPAVAKYEPPSKSHLSDKDSSDSDVDSPPSIKQDSENSISDPVVHKPPPGNDKTIKKPRERTKASDKEDKSRKRKASKKDERESSLSPPPAKQSRKDLSKSPSIHERPSSSDSAAHHSHTNNNNNIDVGNGQKISNEYMTELKELKHKISILKNNDDLQQVVRLIAATGCYEITKSSFDFDLVQLDRGTVQRLQEFFATSS